MTLDEARAFVRSAAWMESWADTVGHPDEQRHAHASAAQQVAERAIEVIWEAGWAGGRLEAYGEVNGQLSL